MPDRDKVIKGLKHCINHDGLACISCPYDRQDCVDDLCADVLALLKEQETKIEQLNRFVNGFSRDAIPVVRCKDCKYWDAEEHDCNIKIGWFACGADWFCADGERRAEE